MRVAGKTAKKRHKKKNTNSKNKPQIMGVEKYRLFMYYICAIRTQRMMASPTNSAKCEIFICLLSLDKRSVKGALSPPQFQNTHNVVLLNIYCKIKEMKGGSVTTWILKYLRDCPNIFSKTTWVKMGLCPHLNSEIFRWLCPPKHISKDKMSENGALSPPPFWNTHEILN